MSLSIGIVGLPNVGKSTLFQLITKKQVDRSNYPFCTIESNIGVVAVSDERVDKMAELTHSAKKIYTTVEFVDIAGLVKGANQGAGLGNKFLAHVRNVDALVYVLRCFRNEKVINTLSKIDVLNEKEILDTEMALKDLETVEKRIHTLEKEARGGKREAIEELEILKKAQSLLEKGQVLMKGDWDGEERKIINGYQLLTLKPRMYLLNGREDEVSVEAREFFQKNNLLLLVVDVLTELESADLKPEERVSLGLPADLRIDSLIKECYKLLDLLTFFTTAKAGEIRAWPLKKGKTASQSGGIIHSDFEKFFIKAEVINWQELLNAGGFVQAREKGLIRTEGKEYVVRDGDVIEIKSNA